MQPADGGGPFSVFETGAILIYLADKTGRFLSTELRARSDRHPMGDVADERPRADARPARPFRALCGGEDPYAIERYRDEAARLYGVLDRQLGKTGAYVAGDDYSIADIACFPWTMTHKAQGFTLDDYPNIKRWYADGARPAAGAGGACDRQVRQGAVRRGIAQEHVRRSVPRSWWGRSRLLIPPSLRGAQRRSNPDGSVNTI